MKKSDLKEIKKIDEKDKTDSEKAKNNSMEKAGGRGTSGLKFL